MPVTVRPRLPLRQLRASAARPNEQAQAAAGTLLPEDVSDANPSWGWTAGSVISTPDDLVIWVDALVSGTLLDAATQQLRLDSIQGIGPDYPQAEGVYGYGYGIDRLGTYYGHGGQITGYNTAMSRDPDTETTVIVVAHPHPRTGRHAGRPHPLQRRHQRAGRRRGRRLDARRAARRSAPGRLVLQVPSCTKRGPGRPSTVRAQASEAPRRNRSGVSRSALPVHRNGATPALIISEHPAVAAR